jgi:hypothetical protein
MHRGSVSPWSAVLKTWDEGARKELRSLARKGNLDVILLADTELDRETALDLIAFFRRASS